MKTQNRKQTLARIMAAAVAAITVAGTMLLTACGASGTSEGGFNADKNISVITREDGSGTKSAFMEFLGLKGKADISGVIIGNGTSGVLTAVKGNSLSIAYESLGYVTSEVKMLSVGGVACTAENVKSGSYKLARPLSVVYKAATIESGAAQAFYAYLISSNAGTIITEKGYIIPADQSVAYTAQAGLSGTIAISGSTSLQPLMIELAAAFETLQPNVTITVGGGGSGTGYKDAESGVSDFGMISEVFTQTKAVSCTSTAVANDGIALIVNKANPLNDISLEQLKNIYDREAGDSAVTKWSQLITGAGSSDTAA